MPAPTPTSPWNIPLFDGNSPFDPIEGLLNSQSNALNTALNTIVSTRTAQSFTFADLTARNAETRMVAGDDAWQVDTKTPYQHNGTAWTAPGGDTGWLPFPLGSGWASYVPTTWGAVSYRKVGSRVTLRGVATSNAGLLLLGTFPVGFRPAFSAQFTVQLGTGTSGITIDANGAITMSSWPGGTVTVSVGHLSFLVD